MNFELRASTSLTWCSYIVLRFKMWQVEVYSWKLSETVLLNVTKNTQTFKSSQKWGLLWYIICFVRNIFLFHYFRLYEGIALFGFPSHFPIVKNAMKNPRKMIYPRDTILQLQPNLNYDLPPFVCKIVGKAALILLFLREKKKVTT